MIKLIKLLKVINDLIGFEDLIYKLEDIIHDAKMDKE